MLMIDTATGQVFETSEAEVNKIREELNNKLLRDGILHYSDCPFIPVYTNLKSPDVSNLAEVFYELEFKDLLKEL